MKQQHQRATAQIIAFPKRPPVTSHRDRVASQATYNDMPFAAVECGAGWYHDAAVEDAVEVRSIRFRKH
jgi:hypothetical protein